MSRLSRRWKLILPLGVLAIAASVGLLRSRTCLAASAVLAALTPSQSRSVERNSLHCDNACGLL